MAARVRAFTDFVAVSFAQRSTSGKSPKGRATSAAAAPVARRPWR
jgi:hypothetical protein